MPDPCKLLTKYKPVVLELAEETLRDGLEHGLSFCVLENGETYGYREVLSLPFYTEIPLCTSGKVIGAIHTHPAGDKSEPSDLDIASTLEAGVDFSCILNPLTKEVKCIVPNKNHPKYQEYKELVVQAFTNEDATMFSNLLKNMRREGILEIRECQL